jgi:hypothetical protein
MEKEGKWMFVFMKEISSSMIQLPRNPTGFFIVPQIYDTGQTALLPF